MAVRAHEQGHIEEYHQMAQNLGLKVVNPHISVFTEYFPEINRQAAVGGRATCQFAAKINGQEVIVEVSKDGHIIDSEVAKRLEEEKKRRMGLLKPKKKDSNRETVESEKQKVKRGNPEEYLFFDGQ